MVRRMRIIRAEWFDTRVVCRRVVGDGLYVRFCTCSADDHASGEAGCWCFKRGPGSGGRCARKTLRVESRR
jgi:hypothetical protein